MPSPKMVEFSFQLHSQEPSLGLPLLEVPALQEGMILIAPSQKTDQLQILVSIIATISSRQKRWRAVSIEMMKTIFKEYEERKIWTEDELNNALANLHDYISDSSAKLKKTADGYYGIADSYLPTLVKKTFEQK